MKNYATNLAREVFTVDERSTHNVLGACGKPQLDPDKIEFIKRLSIKHFPLSNSENSHKAWQDCVKAIDSASRSLACKLKENIPEQTVRSVHMPTTHLSQSDLITWLCMTRKVNYSHNQHVITH